MTSSNASVKVRGLDELIRDFGRMEAELRREVQRELQAVAKIVSDDAQRRASEENYGPRTVSQIRPRVRNRSTAVVDTRAKKTSGLRPDFGPLLMRKVFLPALFSKREDVERAMGELLDRLASKFGFGRGGVL